MPQSPSQKQQRMLEKAKSEKLFENVYEDERMTRKTQTTLHAIGTKDATQQAKRRKSRVHMQTPTYAEKWMLPKPCKCPQTIDDRAKQKPRKCRTKRVKKSSGQNRRKREWRERVFPTPWNMRSAPVHAV
jgi:hypothetical protein